MPRESVKKFSKRQAEYATIAFRKAVVKALQLDGKKHTALLENYKLCIHS